MNVIIVERPEKDEDVTRRGLSTRDRQLLEDMYRPGLSAGISGAGFRENISIASTVSQSQQSPAKDTRWNGFCFQTKIISISIYLFCCKAVADMASILKKKGFKYT